MTDTTRRQTLANAGLALFGASFTSSSRAAEDGPSASDSRLNVRDFGAKGDGVADDTAAFQKALEAAGHASGGIVFVPTGNHLIKGHLVVPDNVTLEGVFRAPTARTQYRGNTLLAVESQGKADGEPFIFLHANSVLKGVTVFYPEQNDEKPVPYPWCVRGIGDNCAIQPSAMTLVGLLSHASSSDFGRSDRRALG
jgi:hypothetical protein